MRVCTITGTVDSVLTTVDAGYGGCLHPHPAGCAAKGFCKLRPLGLF